MKRRGNRRYYQHHEVLMIRRIRDLLYDQGFTISGARNKLQELVQSERERRRQGEVMLEGVDIIDGQSLAPDPAPADALDLAILGLTALPLEGIEFMRRELFEIRKLLNAEPEFAL
jgi:DNA-binding transcriptional MerR regulator